MKSAVRFIQEDLGIVVPAGSINGSWFAEHNLPMIVECSCCCSTMTLFSALIDESGDVYCTSCVDYEGN